MKVHPIMFSAAMINALLADRKTMTRRRAWNPTRHRLPTHWQKVIAGDRLWVREAMHDKSGLRYAADDSKIDCRRAPDTFTTTRTSTMPGMFMPRWASRLTLVVTATKIERLQDLTAADAAAEGIGVDIFPKSSIAMFRGLWDSLHGMGAWEENPDVVAMTFVVHKTHVDAMPPPCPSCGQATRFESPFLMCDNCKRVVGTTDPKAIA